jgi:hypothetical protein
MMLSVAIFNVLIQLFNRYANRSARFIDAYRKGLDGEMAIWANKKYHGHRVLPDTIIAEFDLK